MRYQQLADMRSTNEVSVGVGLLLEVIVLNLKLLPTCTLQVLLD